MGYLRSDLCSNLKYTDPNLAGLQQQNQSPIDPTCSLNASANSLSSSFYNYHSTTLLNNEKKSAGSNNQASLTSNHHNKQNVFNNDQINLQCGLNPSTVSSTASCLSQSSSNQTLHYLIAYGQVKQKLDDETNSNNNTSNNNINTSAQHKFMSRHDADGKFIYVDPW